MKYIEFYLFIPLVIALVSLGVTFPFKQFRFKERSVRFIFQINALAAIGVSAIAWALNYEAEADIFDLVSLTFNRINFIIYIFSSLLLALVAKMSFKYIHKEIGFYKFFLNLALFWMGLFLFIFGEDYLVLFSGWEFIGISSIFLISFYDYRQSPIRNSLYVMSFYKFADIILITALLLLENHEMLEFHSDYKALVYIGIIIAGLIKSASFPFTSWLPRSMEGPTTSSAIYYVALSVNTGIILIYKFLPEIIKYEAATNVLLISGILTVIFSSLLSRVQTDAKTSLGYSSAVQIGLILIEFSFGFQTLGLIHLCLNSFYKLYQFIKSPSLLNTYHSMVGDNRGVFEKTGKHFEFILPKIIRTKLYYYTLNGFYVDSFYVKLSDILSKLSVIAEQLFYPLINKTSTHSYRTLFWVFYYIIVLGLLGMNAFEINGHYFDIIPFVILLISFSLLFEKNDNSFVAMFMIYKILESFIIHGVHSHEPYKWFAILVLTLFIFLIIKYEKNRVKSKHVQYVAGSILIFLMLYFTNFPFFLQSLVNEDIIEAFLEEDNILDLVYYCFANTFLNIGLYNFIFNKVYMREAIDG